RNGRMEEVAGYIDSDEVRRCPSHGMLRMRYLHGRWRHSCEYRRSTAVPASDTVRRQYAQRTGDSSVVQASSLREHSVPPVRLYFNIQEDTESTEKFWSGK